MKEHSKREWKVFEADEDAVYDEEYTIDLSTLRPTIAFPHLPENTKTIDEITENVKIDQVVIGYVPTDVSMTCVLRQRSWQTTK